MKICSVCLKCYDDSDAICTVDEGHGSLTRVRQGNCQVVEGYRIESRFESDSPVELFKATHAASNKSVVIRFIKRDDSVSGLEKELEALVCLEHPNLAGVIEFGEVSENEIYIVFEGVSGPALHERLIELSPLSEREAITIVRQTAEALDVLHTNGLVHGSVNPSNIYLTETENGDVSVKLHNLNFGAPAQKTAYFSPEQSEGAEADFRTDIYSLAVVFYEALLGRLPYDPEVDDEVRNYVFENSEVWHLHFELRALISHLIGQSLQKRVELRPKSINGFVSQMRQLELIANRITGVEREVMSGNVIEMVPVFESGVTREPTPEPVEESSVFLGTIDEVSTTHVLPEVVQEPEVPGPVVQAESDFVEVPIGRGMLTDPVRNRAVVPKQKSIAARAALYAAGLLISAVFGGVVALNVFDWQDASATAETTKSDQKPAEKKQKTTPDNSPEVAAATEPTQDDDSYERKRELDQVVLLDTSESDSREKPAAKGSKSPKVEKQKSNRIPRKRQIAKKAKKPEQTPRPGVFEDIIIYY